MSYAFRIHEPKAAGAAAPKSASTMAGWTETGFIAGNLLSEENIPLGRTSNKMGTSIPSIFARIFLFDGAFQALDGKSVSKLDQPSADTALVSECLDLIEFLFQHGSDSKLIIRHWNATEQIRNLRAQQAKFPEHGKLAQVLEDEIALYRNLNDIFLFFWKDSTPTSLLPQEFLIGGTSPYTLVFTSPNWARIVKENNFGFNRLDGSPLFDSSHVASLKNRDGSFKDMLYSLRMAYQGDLTAQASWFNKYLTTMWNDEKSKNPVVKAMGGAPGAFISKYATAQDDQGAAVMAAMLPVCYLKEVSTASGYEIVARSNRYAHYTAKNGTPITIAAPLVLNENGLSGVKYIGNSLWNSQSCKINEAAIRGTEMHERIAPGQMGVKCPFLIWSDFLEDKIIKLPFKINNRHFITAFAGQTQYVLPLKRMFFKYFNIEDIESAACEALKKKLVEISIGSNSVIVTINVPICDTTHHVIELKREYKGADIVTPHFTLGFFPFYRCQDNNLNRYSVMNCGNGAKMSFLKVDSLEKPVLSSSVIRTPQQTLVSQTEYYLIRDSFDLVEVRLENAKGMIIPQMQVVGTPTNQYKFAVDFGTSNTYIAHTTTNNPHPVTLEIDAHDQQTVYLNEPGDLGELYMMRPFMAREFAPIALGQEADIAYPARTATCETTNFERTNPDLFGTISIGFNMMNEPQAANYFVYKTGLKWLLEEHPGNQHHTNRVKFYFLQTLWMLKNESLMNNGDDQFEVYITFPETMKQPTKTSLIGLWQWAKKELNINCTFFYGTQYSESIAPYNCMATRIGGASFLNIDIGGGTNDLLFVNKDAAGHITNAHYSSSMFAGDDLWGDGVRINANNPLNNGFVDYLYTEIQNTAESYRREILSPLVSLKSGVTSSSADVMGYLFKYDNEFGTSAKIMGQRNLYSLVFIHYAALMFNVSRLIKKMGIEIPLRLSFTGMGSKYINLISPDRAIIKRLTILLLEKYTGKKVGAAFEIINHQNADVKEITAKGVLEGLGLNPGFQIPTDVLQPVVDYGFDCTRELTYADVETEEIRNAALDNFDTFVTSLRDRDFANFLFRTFNLTISSQLLDDLSIRSRQSFVTMSANIPAQYSGLNVTETLFFWPLKNALVELSQNYSIYQ